MRSAASRSSAMSADAPDASRTISLGPRQSTLTPSPRSSASIASTSRIRGTLRSTTSSLVSSEAARMGRAPFLLPAGTTVPDNGTPPSITNFCIAERAPI